ncbi:diaminopimelate epimerase [Actinophytocola oryzae]|uniref:Diaminopimelate epimerase n=1 Tax=Actinophytocola oryzae TaxID=502181 RepID=A0A4R7UUI4_9PSEU|nr:diaminopimelate epimerase [Actinophytocola oryzae]TDV40348.1 diaminopimelate epimerase [Actinophytocola oryzae]
MGIPFLKGHGTQNDFVLLPDLYATLDLTPARVRVLCDRRAGLGADGVLRVVPSKAVDGAEDGLWFMDYRNGDGSVAEMCGNGVRVFARYLVDAGLVTEPEFTIGTRAGVRHVTVADDITVEMGKVSVTGTSLATVAGATFAGVAVNVGNPHLVCVVENAHRLASLDLSVQPWYDPEAFPEGVNIEFVVIEAPDRLRMRVHERGVGETRSCGTGTVAAVTGVLFGRGAQHGAATVDVPGGRVRVTVEPGGSTLAGPAVFTARGELDQAWWDRLSE